MRNDFARALNRWYLRNARPLPWRQTTDPYKIWISEMMLQQTTVATVVEFYKRWIKDYPKVTDVAAAPMERLLKSWQGLGYYQRVRNIHKAARIFVDEHGGRIPDRYDILKGIPGFGPYTTGAVLSIAYDRRYPIVDANIRRVVMRLLAQDEEASSKLDPLIYDHLEKLLPTRNLRTFNQALMELGALVCKSKEPLCSMCPVKSHCAAFRKGVQERIPRPKEKLTETLEVAVGVLRRGDKFFIQKRPAKGLLADLWEFPGGKIEKGETPVQALRREIREELDIDIHHITWLVKIRHFYTKFRVNLHAYACIAKTPPKRTPERRWVTIDDCSRLPMPSGTAKLVEFLRLTNPVN